MRRRVLGMVLAGGMGKRLQPLTRYRSKPSVPFGGMYRIIDFVLSNFVNSGIKSLYVLTQFKSQSLSEHIRVAWTGTNLWPGHFIIPVPAQMQAGEVWYRGTADAIHQNLNLVRETEPDLVCIFGSDHIYYMDVVHMLRAHVESEADVTIASIPMPKEEGSRFGVLETEAGGRVKGFHEKVATPPTIPGDDARCLVSMGNYVFTRAVLEEVLELDASLEGSSRDFGKDVLPKMVTDGRTVHAYDFETNPIPGMQGDKNTYWRDIGTLDAYYEAALDLKEPMPHLDLLNRQWPVHTAGSNLPPSRVVRNSAGGETTVVQSLVGPGNLFHGAHVSDSVLGTDVHVDSGASIEASILMEGVRIGPNCRVRRAILDKGVRLERGTDVGHDADADRDRGWHVTESGITVIPKQPASRPVTTLDL